MRIWQKSIQYKTLETDCFENLKLCIVKYTSMCLYFVVYKCFIINSFVNKKIENQHTDMQIRQCFEFWWGLIINANVEMLTGNADASYPDADPDAT